MSRFLVGIDLGTTNCALAYVDTTEKVGRGGPTLHSFDVPQLTAPGRVQSQPLLPSFLYLPGPHDLPPGATAIPWNEQAAEVVGSFARSHGAKVPGRQVASAKSWLCHPGVDRTAPLLPWAAPPDVPRFSPLDVSAKYLKHLVDAWNAVPGRKPEDRLEECQVVVTVPASFDDTARNLTADAAKRAGLKHVSLLEEPQAAFYAWLGTHPPAEATQVEPGMRCVVVDVGGGTSDFSLIRAIEGEGDLAFERDAVGEHLLLGGDNMDLALAKATEARLAVKPDAVQFGALIQACRSAKEQLLGPNPPASMPVTVVGRGRSVVGGTVSGNVTQDEVTKTLFDGFFPAVSYDSEPTKGRAGLQEMGLPYVADPAVTKHLAAFLRQHIEPGKAPELILFNGGVFQPEILRKRLVDVMRGWFGAEWNPLVLTTPSLDLAVAWGAAYFAWLKHSGGTRIGGGIPRSYYVGLEQNADSPTERTVLCVVPQHLQEGESVEIPEPTLELALGEPVSFPLFTSAVRSHDKAGEVLPLHPKHLKPLPALHTVLRGGKRSGVKRVPITLAAKCTEIGTLELFCVSKEGNRWKLEFNVRDILEVNDGEDETTGGPTIGDVFPEEKLLAASDAIRLCYRNPEVKADAKADTGTGDDAKPSELTKRLESALESSRLEWPTGLCRRVWESLAEVADQRGRSPGHLSRWYNLAGFTLRPGYGDPLDRYRIDAVWKLVTSAASSAGAGAATANVKALPEGGADYWIMWRRLAGGLNTALQQSLFAKLRPTLLPAKGKAFSRPHPNEYAEMWRAAAALERIDARTKQNLAESLLKQIQKPPVPTYAFWSLTRLGARVPLYGPLNGVVHPDIVAGWLTQLLAFSPANEGEKMGWGFCLAQLARLSGMRAVDISDHLRRDVAKQLHAAGVPPAWPRMVEEIVKPEGDDQNRLFGESLPIGLRLAGG
ncbi:MAG: Hsp70 family protein [Gemmataceae bacterium]